MNQKRLARPYTSLAVFLSAAWLSVRAFTACPKNTKRRLTYAAPTVSMIPIAAEGGVGGTTGSVGGAGGTSVGGPTGGHGGENDLDADNDGKISEAEFSAPLREAFARMDADHSGFIETGERGTGHRSEIFVHRIETQTGGGD